LSNVRHWLDQRGIAYDDALCIEILGRAKSFARTLTDQDVSEIIANYRQR